jgi:Flp pilus assembly protein TadG
MKRSSDEGSVPTLELVLLTPVLLALLLFVVFAGRVGRTEQLVHDAVAAGARAASLRQDPDAARADATAVVTSTLAGSGVVCPDPAVSFPTLDLRPGGMVTIVVVCRVGTDQLTLLRVGPARTVSAHATEVVDSYRAG